MKRDTGPNALRRGRASEAGFEYFLTLCVADRKPVLTGQRAERVLRALHASQADGCWLIRCATIMPDHVHLLIRLGAKLTLSQAIARFKVATKGVLSTAIATWQANYYDHRLRSGESVEPAIRYIHLNPYQAELIEVNEAWPWFYCAPEDWAWFNGLTDSARPFPEWLQ